MNDCLTASRLPATPLVFLLAGVLVGCGTTRFTDTARTATEQLLLSDAIDQAVQEVDFTPLAGQKVFFDDQYLQGVVDQKYLVSTLRQHLLASGCVLQENKESADFVVEARAGAIGTDRHDLLFGVPATNVPQIFPFQTMPAAIPEVPIAKRIDQRGIAKLAVFAYHRETHVPVWQSGLATRVSSSNDVWLFGAGPFRHGTIYDGPIFAGRSTLRNDSEHQASQVTSLDRKATFTNPADLVQHESPDSGVVPATFEAPHEK
jgi:hypothetical protein